MYFSYEIKATCILKLADFFWSDQTLTLYIQSQLYDIKWGSPSLVRNNLCKSLSHCEFWWSNKELVPRADHSSFFRKRRGSNFSLVNPSSQYIIIKVDSCFQFSILIKHHLISFFWQLGQQKSLLVCLGKRLIRNPLRRV